MANVGHQSKLNEGARLWNEWRAQNPGVVPDLEYLALSLGRKQFGAVTGGPVDLSSAQMTGADLIHATLTDANFDRAVLVAADLSHARVNGANFTHADLAGAIFDAADLSGAVLTRAILGGARLHRARNLTQAQIETARGDPSTTLPPGLEMPPSWLPHSEPETSADLRMPAATVVEPAPHVAPSVAPMPPEIPVRKPRVPEVRVGRTADIEPQPRESLRRTFVPPVDPVLPGQRRPSFERPRSAPPRRPPVDGILPPPRPMDPYAQLGVNRRATTEEIKQAYIRRAKELHPDRRPGDQRALEQFKLLAASAELLRDPLLRRRFDQGEIDASGRETAAGLRKRQRAVTMRQAGLYFLLPFVAGLAIALLVASGLQAPAARQETERQLMEVPAAAVPKEARPRRAAVPSGPALPVSSGRPG